MELVDFIYGIGSVDADTLAGYSPLAIGSFLFLLTFVTEDGACILAGTLAASGVLPVELSVAACFAGIFIGDTGLFLIGRRVGSVGVARRILDRFVSGATLQRATEWLQKNGLEAIFVSRFVAGLRLPTYLAAGFLGTSFLRFSVYFFLAAAVWTPLIVLGAFYTQEFLFGPNLLLGAVSVFFLIRLALVLSSWKKRRRVYGTVKKIFLWEFWPIQIFYAPVVIYCLYLGIRNGGLTVFTSANPAMPMGGFVGESKDEIYKGLSRSEAARPYLLKHLLIKPSEWENSDPALLDSRLARSGLAFPLALKPDSGERGKGVSIIKDMRGLQDGLASARGPMILQEFAPGVEFSVFHYRFPGEEEGNIFSITAKEFPVLYGDGKSTIEELVLSDDRAVCIRRTYLKNLGDPERVPAKEEKVPLVEIGTHAKGAIFGDGGHIRTRELEEVIDEICRGYSGFYFGRFDLRATSEEDLRNGKGLKIVELNGVTSESTNIYDSRFTLLEAYRTLFRQWKIAFEIGRINRRRGCGPVSALELLSRTLFRSGDERHLNGEPV